MHDIITDLKVAQERRAEMDVSDNYIIFCPDATKISVQGSLKLLNAAIDRISID